MGKKVLFFLAIAILLATAISMAKAPKAAQKDDGKTIFGDNCVTCHGPDGAGTDLGKTLDVADLRSPAVQKQSDAQLTQVITEGKGNMPAFKTQFSPKQIASVLSYVRTLGKSHAH